MNANYNKTDENPLSAQVAKESAMAHRSMRRYFESIERAVEADQFDEGAKLLSELINVARDHFTTEETIASAGGKPRSAGGRLLHSTFVSRARALQERCLTTTATEGVREGICNELVMLLSDMVESDLRIQKRIDDSPDITSA